jgi:hypothetical protein
MRPNGGDHPKSILKLSKTWLHYLIFFCDEPINDAHLKREKKKRTFGGSPQLINMRLTMLCPTQFMPLPLAQVKNGDKDFWK